MKWHSSSDLRRHGVQMVDSTAVYVSADIELARIATEGVVFYPGVRLTGAETLVCPNTTLGELGGVVLHDVAVGPGARVQRGSAEHSTLLAGAVLGPDAHVRSGTILEEGASTAHAVGLKQTLIAAYACIGSNVNMCDCYLGGGRSSSDHSEVGSGFIHFNFSPFGASGDKASASIFGPVPQSVLLNADRVFLGGAGGVVGPVEMGFGVVLAAGGVYRKNYGDGRLVLGEPVRNRSVKHRPHHVPGIVRKLDATKGYLGQLMALGSWYRDVRLPRALDSWQQRLIEHALVRLDEGVDERLKQAERLIAGATQIEADSVEDQAVNAWREWCTLFGGFVPSPPPAPLVAALAAKGEHGYWVRSLSDELTIEATEWLEGIVQSLTALG